MTTPLSGIVVVAVVLAGWTGGGERACPVTRPGEHARDGFNHGHRSLAVALWPRGRMEAEAKLGWWRGVEGRLVIRGERLDGPAPPLRAGVPEGYGATGFQPSGLTFPAEGCWRVSGSVGEAELTFVVSVAR